MQKVILYYLFVEVPDPETVMKWQRSVCEQNNLKGRIIVSKHGINGTIGGHIDAVKKYIYAMNGHSRFKGIEYKWSDGKGDEFPKLSVKVRDELVTLAPGEEFDVFDAGIGLRPKQWHELLEQNPDMPVLDARNNYESEIGHFRNAIKPDIRTFKEIKQTLAELPKDQPIATYCTGDIRCEYLSAYMKHVGFETVYHLDGGIVKYGEKYRDKGLYDGKCYVFDQRKNLSWGNPEDVASCTVCGTKTSNQVNCIDAACPRQIVACESCVNSGIITCETCDASAVASPAVAGEGAAAKASR